MKKLAIIVGGSSGIGKSIVEALNEEYVVAECSRRGNIKIDVTDRQSVDDCFSFILKEYGRADFLVYCSGFVEVQGIKEITEDSWNKTIETNITGAYRCTQEFLKICNRGAKIIYISSTASLRPSPGWSSYACSKAALNSFTLTMNEELKDDGIKAYSLAVGRCNTDLRKKLVPNEDGSKIMQPESVAEFIYNIIKNDNLLNGQVIQVKQY